MKRRRMRALRSGIIGISAALLPLGLVPNAATDMVETQVERVMAESNGGFGGCMARLATSPSTAGLDCASKWVTFSCTGVHTSKSNAVRLYEAAQLAFVTNRTVRVWVDDTRKHGVNCFASRIDVLAE